MLNLIAMAIYAAVSIACLIARNTAARRGAKAESRTFAFAGLIFVGLIVLRGVGAEDMIHETLRDSLMRAGDYAERRSFQKPAVVSGLLVLFGFAFYKGYRFMQAPMRFSLVSIVSAACWVMIALIFVRTSSWHTTDKMLFGPLHVNWFLDLGCTLVTGLGSILYVRRPEVPVRHRHTRF